MTADAVAGALAGGSIDELAGRNAGRGRQEASPTEPCSRSWRSGLLQRSGARSGPTRPAGRTNSTPGRRLNRSRHRRCRSLEVQLMAGLELQAVPIGFLRNVEH